jgi:hypothetical protein
MSARCAGKYCWLLYYFHTTSMQLCRPMAETEGIKQVLGAACVVCTCGAGSELYSTAVDCTALYRPTYCVLTLSPYFFSYLSSYLSSYFFSYLSSYFFSYLSSYFFSYLSSYFFSYLSSYFFSYLSSYLPYLQPAAVQSTAAVQSQSAGGGGAVGAWLEQHAAAQTPAHHAATAAVHL